MDSLTAYEQSYKNGYKDGFAEARRWHGVDEPPKEEKEYLVKVVGFDGGNPYPMLLYFTNDLYQVNKYDFHDKKGIPGFYRYSSEWGNIEYKIERILGWLEIPK